MAGFWRVVRRNVAHTFLELAASLLGPEHSCLGTCCQPRGTTRGSSLPSTIAWGQLERGGSSWAAVADGFSAAPELTPTPPLLLQWQPRFPTPQGAAATGSISEAFSWSKARDVQQSSYNEAGDIL